MKIFMFILLFSIFFIACSDGTTTVKNTNCADACDTTWQLCNEETQKCEPQDGFCSSDEICKDKSETPVCNLVTHLCVADGCSDMPCDGNTENGNTICELDDSTEGFSCVCDEGFEFDENNKCVVIVINPCDAEPCKDNVDGKTICQLDETVVEGYTCEAPMINPCDAEPCKDDVDGKTICKEDGNVEEGYVCVAPIVNPCDAEPCKDDADGKTKCLLAENVDGYVCSCEDGFELNSEGVCNEIQCENVCDTIGATKCIGDRLIECVKDDVTYCIVWEDVTEATDCGAGLCTDNNDGSAYCDCQECTPETFNTICSEDVSSYQYCKEDNGCFTIETVDCEAGNHCEDADGGATCLVNTCVDDPACSSADFTRCATTGGVSILQGCKVNEEGCLVLYTADNCDSKNMECDIYNDVPQCLGGNGTDTCENSANSDNEILASGIWFGTTSNKDDDYQGCDNDMDGNDVVYGISIQQGESLSLSLAEFEASTFSTIKPTIYVLKGNCNNNNSCFKGETNDDKVASITLTNMEAGYYNIVIDRNPGVADFLNGYNFVLTVDLQ